MNNILPCPCCGGEARPCYATDDFKEKYWGVGCISCAIRIDTEYYSPEQAIRVWNETVGNKK